MTKVVICPICKNKTDEQKVIVYTSKIIGHSIDDFVREVKIAQKNKKRN